MNGALVDEIYRRGLMNLIPETPGSVGRAVVGHVLSYMAFHADAGNRIAYGAAAIADDLGLHRRDVTTALDVLSGAGLIARTGRKRGRSVEYVLPVESWPQSVHRPPRLASDPRADVAGYPDTSGIPNVSGDVSGDVSGNLSGYPDTSKKGSEVKSSRATREDAHEDAAPGHDMTDDDTTTAHDRRAVARVVKHIRQRMPWDRNATTDGVILAAVHAGHTAGAICRYLDPPRVDWSKATSPGVVWRHLQDLAATPARGPETGDRCGECGERESVCRNVPAAVSGHTFRPAMADAPRPGTYAGPLLRAVSSA